MEARAAGLGLTDGASRFGVGALELELRVPMHVALLDRGDEGVWVGWREAYRTRSPNGCLGGLLKLSRGGRYSNAKAILQFVKEYGPLETEKTVRTMTRTLEPVSAYLDLSRTARALLNLAADERGASPRLDSERMADWMTLEDTWKPVEVNGQTVSGRSFVWEWKDRGLLADPDWRRRYIAQAVSGWLRESGAFPVVRPGGETGFVTSLVFDNDPQLWDSIRASYSGQSVHGALKNLQLAIHQLSIDTGAPIDPFRFQLLLRRPSMLFSALAIEMATAVTSRHDTYYCSYCNTPYNRTIRRPRDKNRCPECAVDLEREAAARRSALRREKSKKA